MKGIAMTKEEILFCADTLQDAMARIRQVRSPRMVAELCLVSLCDSRTAETVLSLRSRISRLEEALRSGTAVPQTAEHTAAVAVSAVAAEDGPTAGLPSNEAKAEESKTPQAEPEILRYAGQDSMSGAEPEEPSGKAEAPTREEAVPAASDTAEGTASDTVSEEQLQQILKLAKPGLPMDVRFSVDDPERVRISFQNREMVLEAVPGFVLERLRKQENRVAFAAAAESVLGYSVTVRIAEMNRDDRATRDINELRKFKEVKFI